MIKLSALLTALAAMLVLAATASAESQRPVCPGPFHNGAARCHAHVVTDANGRPVNVSPNGKPRTQQRQDPLTPQDLWSAYSLPAMTDTDPAGTIAIVDAYHYPGAESDLARYRADASLPPCTTDTGCFTQMDQRGGSSWTTVDEGWNQEAALDLDMASAICPKCKLVFVEADDAYFNNLGAAENTAAAQPGVAAISNSYGGSEFLGETSYDSYYNHPGIAITVSSGDSGYGAEYPAASSLVTAVGGTSLRGSITTGSWTETAWSGAGSGCSRYVTKPTWQTDKGCARRTIADVSAVADPYTGVKVYGPSGGVSQYMQFGGTSASAPIIAAMFARGSNPLTPRTPYAKGVTAAGTTQTLHDVLSGSNGSCTRSAAYLCTAVSGYDGPTGLGTPKGTGAF